MSYSNYFFKYCYIIYFISLEEKNTGETKVAILILSILVVMCVLIIGGAGNILVKNSVVNIARRTNNIKKSYFQLLAQCRYYCCVPKGYHPIRLD